MTTTKSRAPSIKRFGWYRMVEHQVNAITFITLVATGLAQKFYTAGWASWLVDNLGGIDTTRWIHRWAGVLLGLVTLEHLAIAIYRLLFRRGDVSMVINKKDFYDVVDNLRYYFGLSDHAARCDRYDYKQKFEYWGVVLGGFVMVGTGLLLWFPTQLYTWVPFLPGELIPAAKAAHSNEAMMAFLIIATWHIYNAVFSPEVFPLDTGIFTGRISVARMKHEHPVEWERLVAEGKVTEEFGDQPPETEAASAGGAVPANAPDS